MAFDIKDYVKRSNDVKSYQKLNKLTDGKYVMAIKDIFFREDKEKTALYFIVGVQVVSAAPVSVNGVMSTPNRVGEFLNIYEDLKGKFDSGGKAMIKCVRAIHGLRDGQLSADQMDQLIREMANGTDKENVDKSNPIQPCRGMLVGNLTSNACEKVGKDGNPKAPFTISNWQTVTEGNDKANIAERRAKLGGDSLPG